MELTVQKWVLIVQPKMSQNLSMPNSSAQAQKFWISMKKSFIGSPNFYSFILPLLIFFSPSLIYIRVHRIDVKEREDPADCLDNDLQQIFGSVISPDLEIMKQEEEKLEGHCRSLLCFVFTM